MKFLNQIRQYELLEILDFDSSRKRMSVIIKDLSTKKIILYCKGAESFVIKKCTSGDFQRCMADIDFFAEQGWRTLALASKQLTETEYLKIKNLINEALNDILERNKKISIAYDIIESGMQLLGATAVEDKLQEDVSITLETIRLAGIKIWVLTGDKKETALNISNSCKHFAKHMEKLIITDSKNGKEINETLKLFDKKYTF